MLLLLFRSEVETGITVAIDGALPALVSNVRVRIGPELVAIPGGSGPAGDFRFQIRIAGVLPAVTGRAELQVHDDAVAVAVLVRMLKRRKDALV